MKSVAVVFVLAVLSLAPVSIRAQEAIDPNVSQLDDVVVLAQRSGAPMWIVTRDDSTLVLVGAIQQIPRDVVWRPDDLQAAAAEADLILTPTEGRVSLPDILRVIWRIRTIGRLPEGQTIANYLSPDVQARLDAVMADEGDQDWRRNSLLILGFTLLQEKAGYGRGRQGTDPVDVVRRAGRRADVPVRPIGTVRGDDIVEGLITAPQQTHVPCVEAALGAAEQGPDAARLRAEAWSRRRVAEVAGSPLEQAVGVCWPWADPDIGPQLIQQWDAAIATSLTSRGTTLAVAPIRLLAQPGGVLDALEARGYEIQGPDWRPEP